MDIAVVGCAVNVTLDATACALTPARPGRGGTDAGCREEAGAALVGTGSMMKPSPSSMPRVAPASRSTTSAARSNTE